jgi:hypothetical protein
LFDLSKEEEMYLLQKEVQEMERKQLLKEAKE